MLLHVTTLSYLIGAAAYLLALVLILVSPAQHRYRLLLLAACAITGLWALGVAAASMVVQPPALLITGIVFLEQFKSAAWMVVAAFALFVACGKRAERGVVVTLTAIAAGAMGYSAAIAVLPVWDVEIAPLLARGVYLAHVLVAVVALLLIENLFRNSGREARWSVKYLCFGLGVAFSYDFFVYAQAALLGHLDGNIYAARGIIQAIAMPLIILSAARSRNWPVGVHISRNFVFHSATLLAAGTYLVIMAVAGYSLRVFDSPWGTVTQASFLMAALVLLAVVLSSGEMQARLKAFINQNFFTYKYDYRVEWMRFIDSISDSATALTIPERVIQALANIIGSTSAKIWIRQDDDLVFHAVAAWNMSNGHGDVLANDPWLASLADCPDVVDLRRGAAERASPFTANLPAWLAAEQQALIVLPLVHADGLIGFVVLGEMRAPRAFHWEDFQLLKIAARQAASYLVEESATRALAQVRKFEDFNHRFAFIVHDVKNLAAQMTLILKNAERHGDNPAFQKDMLHTVGESAARLRGMLEQLKDPAVTAPAPASVDLVDLLQNVATNWKLQLPKLTSDLPVGPLYVLGQAEPLRAVVSHLIQNAADAIGQDGCVGLELHIEGVHHNCTAPDDEKCWAVITVADDGPGMEDAFIENELFRPLNSSKKAGFGIGAFQARQVARDMGGRLDVESKRGHGTRITVHLPYVPAASGASTWDVRRPQEKFTPILRSA